MKISTKEPLTVLVQENNAGMQEVFKHLPYILYSYYQSKLERKKESIKQYMVFKHLMFSFYTFPLRMKS